MVYGAVSLACPDGHFYDQGVQQPLKADTAHSQMDPLMPRVTRPYNAQLRQIQPTHRWVHSCQERQQDHTMHTRGRYSPLTDGSTHAKSDNKTIQCTLETEWQYTIKLMTYTAHLKVNLNRWTMPNYRQLKTDTINQVRSGFHISH